MERDFLEAIRSGRKGSPSFRDGVRYTVLSQAIVDAAATGRRTDVYRLPDA
ncbi:hypothetical protein ACFFNY_35490 [Paenibacillus hodogayensis]|uniref:Gfo/Idh/MocA-like oxidoreductase C-terminal domain-containing protein n=1 Tax=Paenibacillus hodogayensis TaxID=279208 RepID=A0ABV5W8J5_9BACL